MCFSLCTVNIVSAVKLRPVDGANVITDLKILSPKGGVLHKFGNHCFISIFSFFSFNFSHSSVSVSMEKSFASS